MTAPTITVKTCPKCGETKSVDGFHRHRSTRDRMRPECKECVRERARAYHEAHREERNAQSRAYDEAHREERRAYQRAYREAHREEERVYDRDRRAMLGNPTMEQWQEITAKHATRTRDPWHKAEDAYLAASTDRIVDDALELKRTYLSVKSRLRKLRRRGVTLARDAHRR